MSNPNPSVVRGALGRLHPFSVAVVVAAVIATPIMLGFSGGIGPADVPTDDVQAATSTSLASGELAATESEPEFTAEQIAYFEALVADEQARWAALVEADLQARWAALAPPPPPPPAPAPVPTPAPAPEVGGGPPAPEVGSGSVWDALAQCESSGNWAMNSGNGFYGGVQFMHQTWVNMGGRDYAEYPHEATREQQIEVSERLLAAYGWGQWPACSRKLGLR